MNQRPESRSTRVLLILLLVLAALYLAGFVWQLLINLADIILLFFLAWLLSMLLTPVVVWLERRRLPSGAAVALVYLGLTLLLALLIMLLLPSLFIQLVELGRSLPDYVANTEFRDRVPRTNGIAQSALVAKLEGRSSGLFYCVYTLFERGNNLSDRSLLVFRLSPCRPLKSGRWCPLPS